VIGTRTLRGAVLALALTASLGAAACGSDQDPGLVPQDTTGGPTTTSHLLAKCPASGSSETVPVAGCLDAKGHVVRP
jgi:hypothetical protein